MPLNMAALRTAHASPTELKKSSEIQNALADCIIQLQGVIVQRQKVLENSTIAPRKRRSDCDLAQTVAPSTQPASEAPINDFGNTSTHLAQSIRQLQERIKSIQSHTGSPSQSSSSHPRQV